VAHLHPVNTVASNVLGTEPITIALVGVGLTTLLAAGFGLFSTLFAVRTVRRYRLN